MAFHRFTRLFSHHPTQLWDTVIARKGGVRTGELTAPSTTAARDRSLPLCKEEDGREEVSDLRPQGSLQSGVWAELGDEQEN